MLIHRKLKVWHWKPIEYFRKLLFLVLSAIKQLELSCIRNVFYLTFTTELNIFLKLKFIKIVEITFDILHASCRIQGLQPSHLGHITVSAIIPPGQISLLNIKIQFLKNILDGSKKVKY